MVASSKGKCRFSMSASCSQSPAMAARRALLKRIQRQELHKLRQIIPVSVSGKRSRNCDSEERVIADTVRYIDALHATILARVRSGSLPSGKFIAHLTTFPRRNYLIHCNIKIRT